MSFLDHIRSCNRCALENFVPFLAGDKRVGRIRRDLVARLAGFPAIFELTDEAVRLAPALDSPDARTAAVAEAAQALAGEGLTDPWRGEPYPVGSRFGESLFEIERAAVPFFGVRAYGIHLNGFVRTGERLSIWVPRRTADRPTYPGKLDNTVAGGQPAGLSLAENLVKECHEEAGIPRALALAARPVGAITYRMESRHGLKDEVIFLYDLELSPDFTPRNQDGEVEDFALWPAERVMDTVARTDDFKFNCNLVLIDFFIRHGLYRPEDPDYLAVVAGLHR